MSISDLGKISETHWGVIVFRGLLTIAIMFGGLVLGDIRSTVSQIELRMTSAEVAIGKIEARRDAAEKSRDDDVTALLDEMKLLRGQINSAASQISALSAKVEVLLERDRAGDRREAP